MYGSGSPGAPGTWDREVWWALNAARTGTGTGRHRWRTRPPFKYGKYLVTKGEPNLPWGRSLHSRGHLSHMVLAVLFAWEGGEIAGRVAVWHCGARTAYFEFIEEPNSTICPACRYRAGVMS